MGQLRVSSAVGLTVISAGDGRATCEERRSLCPRLRKVTRLYPNEKRNVVARHEQEFGAATNQAFLIAVGSDDSSPWLATLCHEHSSAAIDGDRFRFNV